MQWVCSGKSLIHQLALSVVNGKAVSSWLVLTGGKAGPKGFRIDPLFTVQQLETVPNGSRLDAIY